MYTELHAHSNFSFLDGASPMRKLVEQAASCGMTALALTDHDGLYNACVFTRLARQAGIRPIIGAELTFEGEKHLTFLVQNEKGYANLSGIITRGHLAGSKGKPVLSSDALHGRTEGLICLSGCERSEINRLLIKREKTAAYEAAKHYAELFGKDNFYIELQGHLLPDDRNLCRQLTDIAQALGLKAVASNNVHYATRDGHALHDVLTCIRHGVTLDRSAPYRRSNSEYYLKDHNEMMELPFIPRDAILRTEEIARRCNFNLDFSSFSYPDFPLPQNETATGFLKKLALQRARFRYDTLTEEVLARIDDEIGLIESKGLSGYFLVVWDIIEYARKMGISAQGRGSAASSVVAYVLGITPVDPIRHKLFVGRFLNELSIPDIDIDIATNRREEVIRYVYDTYGRDHAAMVCTYVTFQGRNSIREVGKVLGLPAHALDRMAKTTSYGERGAIESLKEIPEFKSYLDSGRWEHFGRICAQISDFPRHLSLHVGGMIITPKPIAEIVPQENTRAEGRIVCQWDKDSVDDAGLIKFDLLGLRMLSLIDDAKELILKLKGIDLDLERLPPDDPRVYDMISNADTVGVFQVESRAQMQTLPKMRPRSFEDLTIQVSIVRPGPLQGNMVHPFIRRRQGKEPVIHLHPKLKPILDETLGVILFQEQILQVAMAIAGFSAGEGNTLRKVMGRKNAREELLKWHRRFLEGAEKQGIQSDIATNIFEHICGFADFGFCKSHAASFAILCYRSAYLKYYYPAEFYCALLNNQPMGFYQPEVIIGDSKRHGVPILSVDINKSAWDCTIEEGSIRTGFRYVKGIGEEKGGRIMAARSRGLFSSLQDFADRSGLDKRSVQNLVAVGAFSAITNSRRQLLWEAGTIRTAGLTGISSGEVNERLPISEMSAAEETITDYIFQGFSPSRHIIKLYRPKLDALGAVPSSRLPGCPSGAGVIVAGYMVCLQMPPTAKGHFSFITLEDEEGLINIVIRPEVYKTYRPVIRLEPYLVVEGIVEKKDGLINIKAKNIQSLQRAKACRSLR